MSNRGCSNCTNLGTSKHEYPCNECTQNRATDHYKPMTNADRIRNMTDEELEEFLRYFNVCRICKNGKNDVCNNRGCTHEEADNFLKEWLQAEVKEGADKDG